MGQPPPNAVSLWVMALEVDPPVWTGHVQMDRTRALQVPSPRHGRRETRDLSTRRMVTQQEQTFVQAISESLKTPRRGLTCLYKWLHVQLIDYALP